MRRAARVLACTALLAGFAPLGAALAREVRIGTEGAFPPYTFEDRAGVLRGFDIDLGEEICRRAALRCEWVVNDWETILPGLLAGKYDDLPESAFYMVGPIEEVLEKAAAMEAEMA